ncbi:hypothetical protein MMPV_004966 [Pyropia vietnamensis]
MAVGRAPPATSFSLTDTQRRRSAPRRSIRTAAVAAAAAMTVPLVVVVGLAATAAIVPVAVTAAAAADAEPPAPAVGACPSPPTVAAFSLAALGGTWFQAAMSARFARTVEAGAPCITAHYTPGVSGVGGSGGAHVATVRSCMLLPLEGEAAVSATGTAAPSAGEPSPASDGEYSAATSAAGANRRVVACTRGLLTTPDPVGAPGRLALSFPPLSAGRYWVLAVEGGPHSDNGGDSGVSGDSGGDDTEVPPYTTAVVWSCAEGDAPGVPASQDLLVLSRSRGLPKAVVTDAADAAAAVGVELGPDNGMVMTDQGEGCAYADDEGVTVVES